MVEALSNLPENVEENPQDTKKGRIENNKSVLTNNFREN